MSKRANTAKRRSGSALQTLSGTCTHKELAMNNEKATAITLATTTEATEAKPSEDLRLVVKNVRSVVRTSLSAGTERRPPIKA
jgi:hypothetical protein